MQTTSISAAPNPIEARGSFTKEIASYLALAFGISWTPLIGAIKLGLSEEYLNIGVAGPACSFGFFPAGSLRLGDLPAPSSGIYDPVHDSSYVAV
jgi:hypothetical protein